MTKPAKIVTFGGLLVLGIIFGIYKVNLYVKDQNAKTEAANYQIEQLRQSIADSQAKLDENTAQINNNLNKKVTPQITTANIVNQWQNRIARVTCQFTYTDGTIYETDEGSSTLIPLTSITNKGILTAVTNKHVITDSTGNYFPTSCTVGVYGIGARSIPAGYFSVWKGDTGGIDVSNPFSENDNGAFDKIANSRINICHDSQVSVGDQIVILGYPTIGTQNGITATEGIISGIEKDDYVTSAKIDHGNSGGAAILIKNNCWLGIPTEVVAGQLESLGRILKASLVLGN